MPWGGGRPASDSLFDFALECLQVHIVLFIRGVKSSGLHALGVRVLPMIVELEHGVATFQPV